MKNIIKLCLIAASTFMTIGAVCEEGRAKVDAEGETLCFQYYYDGEVTDVYDGDLYYLNLKSGESVYINAIKEFDIPGDIGDYEYLVLEEDTIEDEEFSYNLVLTNDDNLTYRMCIYAWCESEYFGKFICSFDICGRYGITAHSIAISDEFKVAYQISCEPGCIATIGIQYEDEEEETYYSCETTSGSAVIVGQIVNLKNFNVPFTENLYFSDTDKVDDSVCYYSDSQDLYTYLDSASAADETASCLRDLADAYMYLEENECEPIDMDFTLDDLAAKTAYKPISSIQSGPYLVMST